MNNNEEEKNPGPGCVAGAGLFFALAAIGLGLGVVLKGKDFVDSADGAEIIENLRYFFIALVIAVVVWIYYSYRKK